MRIAVVFFAGGNKGKMVGAVEALVGGLEDQGAQVDLIDGDKEVNRILTIYDYIAVGAAPVSFLGGKISENAVKFLRNSGTVSGKRCFAFTIAHGLRRGKTLERLMKVMEAEGMFLKFSSVIDNADEAKAMGKRLQIRK